MAVSMSQMISNKKMAFLPSAISLPPIMTPWDIWQTGKKDWKDIEVEVSK